jgi:hypothetical protein
MWRREEKSMSTGGINDWVGRRFKFTYAPLDYYINERDFKNRKYITFTGELVNHDGVNRTMYIENDREIRIIRLDTIAEMIELFN